MAFKFDGTKLTDGSKTFANVKGDKIWEGQVQAKCLANVKGDKIYEGMNQSRILYKTSDAARKIGSVSQGPLTAALWYLFCR